MTNFKSITAAFKHCDADRTGTLTRQDLRTMLANFNVVDIGSAALDALIDTADVDGDGVITYRQFARMLTTPPC